MSEPAGGFTRSWQATRLPGRPLILPRRHYVYPRAAEEIERGAFELLVSPEGAEPFLATFALGFADPQAPTGVWTTPAPGTLCALAGGYAYLVNTHAPEECELLPYRPVLQVLACQVPPLLLFVGNRAVLAYGARGRAWESPRLSDEGVTVCSLEGSLLRGTGWQMRTDEETSFALDLTEGHLL